MTLAITTTFNDVVDPATSTTPNTPVPGSPVAGDILFDVISWASVTRGPPSYPIGLSLLCQADSSNPDFLPDTAWFAAKTCDGTEVGGSTCTKTLSGATDWSNGMCLVHGDSPYTIVSSQAVGTYYGTNSSITLVAPANVVVKTGDLVLWLIAVSSSGSQNATIASVTQPTGFTEDGSGIDDVWEETMRFFHKVETAGTYSYDGTATFTANNGKVAHVGVFVLRQSGVAATGVQATATAGNVSIPGRVAASGASATASAGTVTAHSSGGGMGIVQTKSFKDVSGTTYHAPLALLPTAPFTSGNFVCLIISQYIASGGSGTWTVTANGVAMAELPVRGQADATFTERIFYGFAGLGSAGVQITYDSTPSAGLYYLAEIIERNDVALVGTLDSSSNTIGGTSTAPTLSVTTTAAATFLAVNFGGDNGDTFTITPPAGWTLAYLDSDGSAEVPTCAAYKDAASSGAQTATFGYHAASTQGVIGAFKLATGGQSVAATGSGGTGSAGTVGNAKAKASTGTSATTAMGTVGTANASPPATGIAAAASAGTVVARKGPASQVATMSAGTVAARRWPSGQQATTANGTVVPKTWPSGIELATAAGIVAAILNIAVTGIAATSASGTVTVASGQSVAVSGSAATASAGTSAPAAAIAAAGSEASAAPGSVAPTLTVTATGIQATTAAGTISIAFGIPASGSEATAVAGTAIPGFPVPVSGNAAVADSGSVAVGSATRATGSEAATSAGTAAPGHGVPAQGVEAATAVGALGFAYAIALDGEEAETDAGNVGFQAGSTVGVGGSLADSDVGDVGLAHALALTGAQATVAAGVVVPSSPVAVSGSSANADVGEVWPWLSVAVTGTAVQGHPGTVSIDAFAVVSGVEATAIAGHLPGARIVGKLVSLTVSNTGASASLVAANAGTAGRLV